MSQEERYNTRDRSYSAWHRRLSTKRFVGIERAQLLAMIDLDCSLYVEYDEKTKVPLALIETAIDVGQPYKPATVTCKLSELAGLPSFVVLYTLSQQHNPADESFNDIEGFRVKRLNPPGDNGYVELTPQQWASYLLQLREEQTKKLDDTA